jgi:tellurite methyltransferase
MADDQMSWDEFYQKIEGREPRPLLLEVLKAFATEDSPGPRDAIDLGCGDGTEAIALLAHGWNVLAIDAEPSAIRRLLEKVQEEGAVPLQTQVAKFEELALPSADLIHASFSLPFCQPEYFDTLWEKIVSAIKPGGRFAGQFFGINDSWAGEPEMTFHTEEQVRALFEQFTIESFVELEEDGQAVSKPKHWHIFTVIAKKIRSYTVPHNSVY